MYLYLVQHAEANSKEQDASRGLSARGLKDIKAISGFMVGMNISVQGVMHSGKKRAMQTAMALNECLSSERGVQESEGLSPMDDPGIWLERLTGETEDVMLVGHMPHMARLATRLMCGERDHDVIGFEVGSVLCLERNENNKWSVKWMIKPGIIKKQ